MARIDYPSAFDAPSAVLERLEELDAELTCFHLGKELWAVGSVRPTKIRYRAGVRSVANQERLPPRMRRHSKIVVGKLRMRGYAHIALYTKDELENGYLVRDVRRRHWRLKNRAEETVDERLDEMEGVEKKRAQLEDAFDYIHTEGADHHRRNTRHSVTGRPISRVTGGFFN